MSQTDSVKNTINNHEYEMWMLPPMTSHNLLVDVSKMIGPSLGSLLDGILSAGKGGEGLSDLLNAELGGDVFSKVFSGVFGSLDNRTIENVIEAFREKTHVDGKALEKQVIFDDHFAGSLDEMYKWLVWGARVQWGKSLGALTSVVGGLGASLKTKDPSPSPTT